MQEVQAESRSKVDEQNQRIIGLEQERTLLSSTVAKQAHLLKNICQQKVILEKFVNNLPPHLSKLLHNLDTNPNTNPDIEITKLETNSKS